MPPKAWSRASLGGGEDVGQFEVDPAARRDGDAFASGTKEAVPQANDRALPGRSSGGRGTGGRDLGLNDEQRGPGPVECQGDGAVGHAELGPGKKADGRQAIGAEVLEIGDDDVDALEMERPCAEIEHDGPIRRRSLICLRWPKSQQGPLCARFGQEFEFDRDPSITVAGSSRTAPAAIRIAPP